jgi:hypothetical protein
MKSSSETFQPSETDGKVPHLVLDPNFEEPSRLTIGWNVSEEDFIPEDGAMYSLRLRAGWGLVGNDRINNYLSTVVVSSGFNYPFGNVHGAVSPGLGLGGIPNPDIQWETAP